MSEPKCRRVVERFVITGQLCLETPTHFGNGDAAALTDMPLLRDEVDQSPLLTGASLAGALRNYLREHQLGYEDRPPQDPANQQEQRRESALLAAVLFGGQRGYDEGAQSALIVHDALGVAADIERRDGVRIDPQTRTAEDEKKFDIELLAAGSTFDLRFELLVGVPTGLERSSAEFQAHRDKLLQALATALDGLTKGEITLGARKRRGFGRCRVNEWQVQRYDLDNREGLHAWLAAGRSTDGMPWDATVQPATAPTMAEALTLTPSEDRRRRFQLHAEFTLESSLLVRAGSPGSGPDMVHLHSPRPGGAAVPILAGTSWAGVLRSRATQIARTLAPAKDHDRFLAGMFGPAEIIERRRRRQRNENIRASRLEVAESEISGGHLLEQTRVKIDRFTGGAAEAALFTERPLFGQPATNLAADGRPVTRLALDVSLRFPVTGRPRREQAEIGLLLLLLKDLWTGDLPLGGESGSGRGRLRGFQAECSLPDQRWTLTQAGHNEHLIITGDPQALQDFAVALKEELQHG